VTTVLKHRLGLVCEEAIAALAAKPSN